MKRGQVWTGCPSSILVSLCNQGLTTRLSSGPKKAKLRRHAPCTHFLRLSRRPCIAGDVSATGRPGDGKPRSEAASDGVQERATPATPRRHGPRILGCAPKLVAGVGEPLGHRQRNTVTQWNRERFRRYWTRISRRRYPGRPRIDAEIR